jgi:hypothetical protein
MAGDVAKGYGGEATGSTADLFNPFAWMKMFTDAAAPMTQAVTPQQNTAQ